MIAGLDKFYQPDTYTYDLFSPELKRTYRLFIGGLDTKAVIRGKRDLIFVVDGNWLFAGLSEFTRVQSIFSAALGSPIIVGIGYPSDDDREILNFRNADLSLSGSDTRAKALSRFIVDHAAPLLCEKLEVAPNRMILGGHSWGGSFALLSLLTPDLNRFDGYIASSPVIIGTSLENYLREEFDISAFAGKKIYSSYGSNEATGFPIVARSVAFLAEVFRKPAGRGLSYVAECIENEDHSSVSCAALYKGLRYTLT